MIIMEDGSTIGLCRSATRIEEKRLMDKMCEERSGFFNKAITAYRYVLLNNGNCFHEPDEAEGIRRKYTADKRPV